MSSEATPVTIKKRVIIFNGPPRVGKDLACVAISHFLKTKAPWLNFSHEKFSQPLKAGVHALFGLFETPEYIDVNNLKDSPHSDLLGGTPRQEYIELFLYLEHRFGPDILGRLLEHRLRRQPRVQVHLISDGGREPEIVPIIEYVGQRNVLLVELSADDRTFTDIRSYYGKSLKEKFPKIEYKKIHNTISDDPTDKAIFRAMCIGLAKQFLGLTDIED